MLNAKLSHSFSFQLTTALTNRKAAFQQCKALNARTVGLLNLCKKAWKLCKWHKKTVKKSCWGSIRKNSQRCGLCFTGYSNKASKQEKPDPLAVCRWQTPKLGNDKVCPSATVNVIIQLNLEFHFWFYFQRCLGDGCVLVSAETGWHFYHS